MSANGPGWLDPPKDLIRKFKLGAKIQGFRLSLELKIKA